MVRGISDKQKFDILTKTTQRLQGDDLSKNQIVYWTTAFIRSIIGEGLHWIDHLKGKVVSVTTDGFISNIPVLDVRLKDHFLFTEFKKISLLVSGDYLG